MQNRKQPPSDGPQGIPVPPEVAATLDKLVKGLMEAVQGASDQGESCEFCRNTKQAVLDQINALLAKNPLTFTATIRRTGPETQEGIKAVFNTDEVPVMLFFTVLASHFVTRQALEYWRKQGRAESEIIHVAKAISELATHMESEYARRTKLIDELEAKKPKSKT